jgi:hypothetical protein
MLHTDKPIQCQGNQYLGSDPDPQVQFDLEREAGSRNGGY